MDFLKDFANVLLFTLWIMIFISFIFLVVRIIADVFRDSTLSGVSKALWLLFIIVFPILGSLVYLFSRGTGMAARDAAQASAVRAAQVEYTKGLMGEAGAASEISQAKELLDSGAITQAEFDALKAKVLA